MLGSIYHLDPVCYKSAVRSSMHPERTVLKILITRYILYISRTRRVPPWSTPLSQRPPWTRKRIFHGECRGPNALSLYDGYQFDTDIGEESSYEAHKEAWLAPGHKAGASASSRPDNSTEAGGVVRKREERLSSLYVAFMFWSGMFTFSAAYLRAPRDYNYTASGRLSRGYIM